MTAQEACRQTTLSRLHELLSGSRSVARIWLMAPEFNRFLFATAMSDGTILTLQFLHHVSEIENELTVRRENATNRSLVVYAGCLFDYEHLNNLAIERQAVARIGRAEKELRMADVRVIMLISLCLGAVKERQSTISSGNPERPQYDLLVRRLTGILNEQLAHWRQVGLAV